MKPSRLSGKERVRAALHMQRVDRLPFTPLLTPYALAGFDESIPHYIPDLMIFLGMDVLLRHIDVVRQLAEYDADIQEIYYFENGELIQGYRTPIGSIYSRSRYEPQVPDMPYISKHLINTIEDLQILKYILQHTHYHHIHDYEEYEYEKQAIGDRGEITSSFAFSPIQQFLEIDSGIANTYELLADDRKLFEEVCLLLHERNKLHLAELAKSPIEFFVSYENTGTTTVSPDIYQRYCAPALKEYADILHREGKRYFIHMCGKLHGLANEVRNSKFDGVFDIAPCPTGDMELWEARSSFGNKVVMGGIDCTIFVLASPEEAYRRTSEIIEKVKPYQGVLLGSGDSVPYGTTLENLRSICRALEELGWY